MLAKGIEEAGLNEEDGLAVKAVQDRFVIIQIKGIIGNYRQYAGLLVLDLLFFYFIMTIQRFI